MWGDRIDEGIEMDGVTEYNEELSVKLSEHGGRVVVVALNEAGWNQTQVDLKELIKWLKANRPELLA